MLPVVRSIPDLVVFEGFDIMLIVSASVNRKRKTNPPKVPLYEFIVLNTELVPWISHTIGCRNSSITQSISQSP